VHPICDIPDCMAESAGRFNIFCDSMDGFLYKQLCLPHLFGLISSWPLIADGLAGKERE
jgi:hypothetical protein